MSNFWTCKGVTTGLRAKTWQRAQFQFKAVAFHTSSKRHILPAEPRESNHGEMIKADVANHHDDRGDSRDRFGGHVFICTTHTYIKQSMIRHQRLIHTPLMAATIGFSRGEPDSAIIGYDKSSDQSIFQGHLRRPNTSDYRSFCGWYRVAASGCRSLRDNSNTLPYWLPIHNNRLYPDEEIA